MLIEYFPSIRQSVSPFTYHGSAEVNWAVAAVKVEGVGIGLVCTYFLL